MLDWHKNIVNLRLWSDPETNWKQVGMDSRRRVPQLTYIWMSGASGLGNLTTEYLNFAKKSPLHCTMGQALLFMCFDPVFVFVGGMLRILWQ